MQHNVRLSQVMMLHTTLVLDVVHVLYESQLQGLVGSAKMHNHVSIKSKSNMYTSVVMPQKGGFSQVSGLIINISRTRHHLPVPANMFESNICFKVHSLSHRLIT